MKRKKRIYILGDVLGILMAVIVFILSLIHISEPTRH